MDHAQYGKTEVEKRRMFEGQLHGAFRSLGLFSSVLVVGVLVLALSANVRAQTKNIFQMTQEERNAYFAKMNTASEEDWQRTVDLLHMKLPPSLPPVAEDTEPTEGYFSDERIFQLDRQHRQHLYALRVGNMEQLRRIQSKSISEPA